jgi:hypothetical protein
MVSRVVLALLVACSVLAAANPMDRMREAQQQNAPDSEPLRRAGRTMPVCRQRCR